MPDTNDTDRIHMIAALGLGRRGLGTTWPNPSVGCVVVRDGRVVGRGYTGSGGRPHAEPTALSQAGPAARGATAYVTLEPCCHWGRTPPCTGALIAAGIARVVIASLDPDERVNHQGVKQLRGAGLIVEHGLLAEQAQDDLSGFLYRVSQKRPMITLKLATTLDGKIATVSGESQWITGAEARRMAHVLRGQHDGVLAGIGTVLADDPELTCRIPGFRPIPVVRIVADSHVRTPPGSRLARGAREAPVWVMVRSAKGSDGGLDRGKTLTDLGVRVMEVPADQNGLDPAALLRVLASEGLTRVLVEGGGLVAASFMRDGLVDRIAWFHAPAVMGGDGLPGVRGFGTEKLAMMPRFERLRTTPLGADMLTEFRRLN